MKNKIYKKILLIVSTILLSLILPCNKSYCVDMDKDMVLKSGISLVENVPQGLMGNWRVFSELKKTDNPSRFKSQNIDLWNLSKQNGVIKLQNPFSGAEAEINVDEVSDNFIKFTKIGKYDSKRLTDTVELRLNNNSFTGVNIIKLESLSDIDNSVIKTETARYNLKGERISGTSIFE